MRQTAAFEKVLGLVIDELRQEVRTAGHGGRQTVLCATGVSGTG